MEFRRAIVDECGTVMYWCSDMREKDVMRILYEHPEWRIVCIEC